MDTNSDFMTSTSLVYLNVNELCFGAHGFSIMKRTIEVRKCIQLELVVQQVVADFNASTP